MVAALHMSQEQWLLAWLLCLLAVCATGLTVIRGLEWVRAKREARWRVIQVAGGWAVRKPRRYWS